MRAVLLLHHTPFFRVVLSLREQPRDGTKARAVPWSHPGEEAHDRASRERDRIPAKVHRMKVFPVTGLVESRLFLPRRHHQGQGRLPAVPLS